MGVVLVVVIVQKLESIELVVVPTNVCLVQRSVEYDPLVINVDFGISYVRGASAYRAPLMNCQQPD